MSRVRFKALVVGMEADCTPDQVKVGLLKAGGFDNVKVSPGGSVESPWWVRGVFETLSRRGTLATATPVIASVIEALTSGALIRIEATIVRDDRLQEKAAALVRAGAEVFKRCERCGIVYRTTDEAHEGFGAHPCGGRLVVDEGCHAVVFHGPGHQSTTRCVLLDDHEVHQAVIHGEHGEWTKMEDFV